MKLKDEVESKTKELSLSLINIAIGHLLVSSPYIYAVNNSDNLHNCELFISNYVNEICSILFQDKYDMQELCRANSLILGVVQQIYISMNIIIPNF